MTIEQFLTWYKQYIKTNSEGLITAVVLQQVIDKLVEVIGSVPFTGSFTASDIDANNEIVIPHGKGTYYVLPVLFDKAGVFAGNNEIYEYQSTDQNNIKISMLADMLSTDFYKYIIVPFNVDAIPDPELQLIYTEVFSSEFDNWTNDIPDGFAVFVGVDSALTHEVSGNDNYINMDVGGDTFIRVYCASFNFEAGKNYRITINSIEPGVNLTITAGTNDIFEVVNAGESQYTYTATSNTPPGIRATNNSINYITSFKIEEIS